MPATTRSPAPPTPSDIADAAFFAGIACTIADAVEQELKDRRVPLIASDEEVAPSRHEGRNAAGTPGVYQVTCLELWPDGAATMPAREFLYKYVRRWSANMGLKLARTGVLSTYPMPLPKGVEQAVLGKSENLVLRAILDYSMHDDRQVLRLDAYASWDE